MPRRSSKFVIAKNESSGKSLLERIEISDPHRFDDVAKRRVGRRGRTHPYKPVPGRRAELARLAELNAVKFQLERQDYANELRRRKLAERLTTPPPLAARIELPEPFVPDVKPLPTSLHFKTNTQVHQLEDFKRKFNACYARLEPFFERLKKEREQIAPVVYNQLQVFGERFNKIFANLENIVQDKAFAAKEWNKIARDLKKLGKHSFQALKPRFVEHCKELVEELGSDWLAIADQLEVVTV